MSPAMCGELKCLPRTGRRAASLRTVGLDFENSRLKFSSLPFKEPGQAMGKARFLSRVSRHAPTHNAFDWPDTKRVACETLDLTEVGSPIAATKRAVLVVDDIEASRHVVCRILRDDDYATVEHPNSMPSA